MSTVQENLRPTNYKNMSKILGSNTHVLIVILVGSLVLCDTANFEYHVSCSKEQGFVIIYALNLDPQVEFYIN